MSKRSLKAEQAVYGYIRNYVDSNNDMNIPDSIKDLCVLFLILIFDILFKWDPYRGKLARDTQIQGTKLKFLSHADGHRTVIATPLILSAKYTRYEWEIQLIEWIAGDPYYDTDSTDSNDDDMCSIQMGYIDMDLYICDKNRLDKNKDWFDKNKINFADQLHNLEEEKYTHVIQFDNDQTEIEIMEEGRYDEVKGEFWIKQGDKCKLIFDFDTREVTFFYNDEKIEVVFKDIADTLTLAVSIYNCAIDCISFKGEL